MRENDLTRGTLPPSERLRIVVLGYIVRGPVGGMAWHHLQYVLGLRALGHEVIFLEDSDDYPSCYDPERHIVSVDPAYGLDFTKNVFSRMGIGDCWAYYDAHTDTWAGPLDRKAIEFCKNADICLNVSGVNPIRPWTSSIPCRVLIDTDPVFTQIKHLTNETSRVRATDHTVFFSFGENISSGVSTCPDDGFDWKATRQPIYLDAWPVKRPPRNGCFSTVMQWDSYETIEYDEAKFGMKSMSFEGFQDLPTRTSETLEMALGSETAPREMLRSFGWSLRNPLKVTKDPWTYQRYIQESAGEFSLSKHGYVTARCGWFSERSAAYLASGRPVIVQDTGFSEWLSERLGVLPFGCRDEALANLTEMSRNYELHSRAARDVCRNYFDSARVLKHLLQAATNAKLTA